MIAQSTILENIGGINRMSLWAPLLVMMALSMVVIPLSPFALDMLFTFIYFIVISSFTCRCL